MVFMLVGGGDARPRPPLTKNFQHFIGKSLNYFCSHTFDPRRSIDVLAPENPEPVNLGPYHGVWGQGQGCLPLKV